MSAGPLTSFTAIEGQALLMTSQNRSRIEDLLPTNNIIVLD